MTLTFWKTREPDGTWTVRCSNGDTVEDCVSKQRAEEQVDRYTRFETSPMPRDNDQLIINQGMIPRDYYDY